MNTRNSRKSFFSFFAAIFVIVALAFPGQRSLAAGGPPSPFIGGWQAVDVDGSDMTLTIGGPPSGPFQITWTDRYISFCDGEAGLLRGTGVLNEADPNLLEADLNLECFTTGEELNLYLTLRYHPGENTLSVRYDFGLVTIWSRSGHQPQPPSLGLRVNYGHDWVESFYEGGHTVWITVTESDGWTVKATAEVVTEPKDFWGGESGFQTAQENWIPAPPDIQPYDWVYGWVDNGASAVVQLGDIRGTIDQDADSIQGTVHAPWFTDEVEVECHPWGAGMSEEILKYDWVLPDGEDEYSCSWTDEWEIQPGQNVGVGYSDPDGHWVANAITAPNPRIVASESGDWFWVTEFYPGILDLFIYESADEGATLLWSGQQEAADLWGITTVGYDVHGQDLLPGNYLVVSDGVNAKGLVLESISVTVFDTENEILEGFAPAGSEVWAAAGPMEWQERMMVAADTETGAWLANFKNVDFDITEEMRPWSFAHIYDTDGDANEGSTPPPPNPRILVQITDNWFEAQQFAPNIELTFTIYDAEGGNLLIGPESMWSDDNGNAGIWVGDQLDLQPGYFISVSDGATTKNIVLEALTFDLFDLNTGLLAGTAPEPYGRMVWVGIGWENEGWSMEVATDDFGNWSAEYGSSVPAGYQWVAVQVFDDDGDASEVRPPLVIEPEP